jgi:(1->4)-alpha-D-glucan 1-alpha-D-glucosylmutase
VRSEAQRAGVDLPTAYLLFQTLVGAWPIDEQRLVDYLRKAVREGKQHTTWTEVNAEYEERVFSLARTCLQTPTISAVEDWLEGLQPAIRAMTLATKLLELTLPGVPDTYQGTELVDLSLVDPDNRRAVDYSDRTARLRALDAGGGAHDLHDEKLLITSRALRARQAHAELVSGDYAALATDSPHVLAFVRGGAAVTVVTRWPNRMSDWGAQTLTVPAGQWRDAFTGALHDGGPVRVRDLLASLPVTLLLKDTA